MPSLTATYPGENRRFVEKAERVAGRLGIDAGHLMAVMDFETGGTFNPQQRAATSSAVGLIQFTPTGLADLPYSHAEVRGMDALRQLDVVEDYFNLQMRRHGPIYSLADTYMAVLAPAAIGQLDSHVLYWRGDGNYGPNSALDTNYDGTITKGEATAFVRRRLRTTDSTYFPTDASPMQSNQGGSFFDLIGGRSPSFNSDAWFEEQGVPTASADGSSPGATTVPNLDVPLYEPEDASIPEPAPLFEREYSTDQAPVFSEENLSTATQQQSSGQQGGVPWRWIAGGAVVFGMAAILAGD